MALGLSLLTACTANLPVDLTATVTGSETESTTGASTGEGSTAPTGTEGPIPSPRSCAEVLVASPGAADGEYTLYADGDPARPWQAWCNQMDKEPAEYLILPMSGDGINFSQYVSGDTTVRTMYSRVRVDPHSFLVEIGDQTFARSTGQAMAGTIVVASLAYAVAMDATGHTPEHLGLGNIDLRGTPFTVSSTTQWSLFGFNADGSAAPSQDDQVVDLQVSGTLGYIVPTAVDPGCPCNAWGGFLLQLAYTL